MQLIRKILAPLARSGKLHLVGVSGLVQLLPLLTAPIIARLYTPLELGAYAIFFALATIIAACLPLALSQAVFIESEASQIASVTITSLVITAAMSLLLALSLGTAPVPPLTALFGTAVVPLLWLLPLTAFLAACFQIIYNWALRQQAFTLLARNKLILGVATAALQIGIGLTDPGAIGFVIANLLGYLFALALLLLPLWRGLLEAVGRYDVAEVVVHLRRHRNLPIWTLPATLVNTVSSYLPEFLINRMFGTASAGQYSLANRMVNYPLSFLATGVQDIFRPVAAAELSDVGHCRKSFKKYFLLLLGASLALALPLAVILPWLFPIIFGAQWDQVGGIIQALILLVLIRFISSPLSFLWILREEQRLDFLWQIGLIAITALAIYLPAQAANPWGMTATLLAYSVIASAWYAVAILVSWRLAYRQKGLKGGSPSG